MHRAESPRSRPATRLELSDAAVGALRLAGVLAQCPVLVELNLAYNPPYRCVITLSFLIMLVIWKQSCPGTITSF